MARKKKSETETPKEPEPEPKTETPEKNESEDLEHEPDSMALRSKFTVTRIRQKPGQMPTITLESPRSENPEIGEGYVPWPAHAGMKLVISDPDDDHGFEIGGEYWIDLSLAV